MIELQGITAQERKTWLGELLKTGSFTVTFTKVDGSQRQMPCTLCADLIPVAPTKENSKPKKDNPNALSVWCLDKKEWRSFRVMNVLSVDKYQPGETTWIIALEEDPETGDLIMPLPDAVLESQGWKIGDTLTWDVDKATQTATLSKK